MSDKRSDPPICTTCENIKILTLYGHDMMFYCVTCDSKTEMKPKDTLLWRRTKQDQNDKFASVINSAVDDPTIKVIEDKCMNCNYMYKGVTHIGESEFCTLICLQCRTTSH